METLDSLLLSEIKLILTGEVQSILISKISINIEKMKVELIDGTLIKYLFIK